MGRSSELRLISISARAKLHIHNEEDLSELLRISEHGRRSGIGYAWRDEGISALVKGWAGNSQLKATCLEGAHRGSRFAGKRTVDWQMSRAVLIHAFPQDDDVAKLIAQELQENYPFNMQDGIWQQLPTQFQNHAVVVQALDIWAAKLQKQSIHPVELSYAALVGKTVVMKQKLLEFLDGWVPFWAVGALLKGWGMSDPHVSDHLFRMAYGPKASEIAKYIPSILQDPKQARERLLALVRDPSSQRLDFIVNGFGVLSDRGDEEEILDACLDRLPAKGFDDMFKDSLIRTFRSHKRIRALALAELEGRQPPLGAIAEAFAADEEMRQKVAELLTPLAKDLRTQIVSQLPSCGDSNFALELLQKWDSEGEFEVKTLACINYNTLIREKNEDVQSSLKQLGDMIPCYGMDHEERRQAALAGLLVLGALDILKEKTETTGYKGQPVEIDITAGLTKNRVLLDCIGKHWDYLKESLQSDFSRLFRRSETSFEFWSHLALVGAHYPTLAHDILAEANQQPNLFRSPNILKMIGRLEPRSDRLLTCCLDALSSRDSSPYGWFDEAEAASSLIAEHFRQDISVEQKLLKLVKNEMIPTSVVMTLSKGWPDSQLLKQMNSEIEADASRRDAVSLYPKYATIGAAQLPSVFASDLAWAHEDWYQADNLLRPVLIRLRNDPSAASKVFEFLTKSSNPSIRATFTKCLASVGGLTVEQSNWCREEISRQNKLPSPELGFDLVSGTVRSVSICLLESLGETVEETAEMF